MTQRNAGTTSNAQASAQPELASFPGRRLPPFVADEREMLDGWLDFYRATLLGKCGGLDDDQLKTRSVSPSPLSLLGLVRHMADVERSWFRRTLAGEDVPPIFYTEENEDADFTEVDDADVAADLDSYRAEVEVCRGVAAAQADLDAVGARKARGVHDVSLRWIYVHVIEEYARHSGHADFLRERIDGATGY